MAMLVITRGYQILSKNGFSKHQTTPQKRISLHPDGGRSTTEALLL